MILVRQVFQAKYGKGDELVALFKEARERMQTSGTAASPGERSWRLLTDASGPFFTVVTEFEVENFAAWERWFQATMAQPEMGEWFSRMVPLVESGSREFYNIVE
jgi:hypothetical protein